MVDVDRVEDLAVHRCDQPELFERVVDALVRGERLFAEVDRHAAELDIGRQLLLTQASSAGSNAKQCGQPYQKNSMTSILPLDGDRQRRVQPHVVRALDRCRALRLRRRFASAALPAAPIRQAEN